MKQSQAFKKLLLCIGLTAIAGCATSGWKGGDDPDLCRAIRSELGKEDGDTLTITDYLSVKMLLYGNYHHRGGRVPLQGIAKCQNLETLSIEGHGVLRVPFDEIEALGKLDLLHVEHTGISRETVTGWSGVKSFGYRWNKERRISFIGLKKVEILSYINEKCGSGCIKNMRSLRELVFFTEECAKLELENTPKLRKLSFTGKHGAIEFRKVPGLRLLYLGLDKMDCPDISELKELRRLYLVQNRKLGKSYFPGEMKAGTVDLSGNPSLREITCDGFRLAFKKNPPLKLLEKVFLRGGALEDYSFLADCKKLYYVDFRGWNGCPSLRPLVKNPAFADMCGLRVTLPNSGKFLPKTEQDLLTLKGRGVLIEVNASSSPDIFSDDYPNDDQARVYWLKYQSVPQPFLDAYVKLDDTLIDELRWHHLESKKENGNSR